MSGILNVRDFNLTHCVLMTGAGDIDLRLIMVEISYHEDIFNNTASGYILISESQGYAEGLGLNGNEFLHLTFNKGGDTSRQIDRYMRVYKLDKRKLEENIATESYCLQFCSEELLLSEQYKISKSYTNMSIDQMILDICTMKPGLNISPNKLNPDNIKKSYGTYDFIVPNLKPLDAINWLCVYALPGPDVPGADMIFFENKNGFNFTSLQNLMDAKDVEVYDIYTYDPKNVHGIGNQDITEQMSNALSYEILNSYDTLYGVNSGVFANQLISVDILTRTRKTTNFDYFAYFNGDNGPPSLGLDDNPIINNYANRNGDQLNQTSQAVLKLVFSNFDEHNPTYSALTNGWNPPANYPTGSSSIAPNINAETYIPWRTAQLSLDNYIRLKLTLPGDPDLTIGSVIKFDLLSNNPGTRTPNAYYSGYYLVTAVRHVINQNEYRTIIEIAKESVRSKYFNTPNSNDWKVALTS